MALLDRLRSWWRSLVGGEQREGDVEDAEPSFEYRCAVCGTGVEGPDEQCPLCRSSDVVRADEAGGGSSDTDPAADDAPTMGERRSGTADDASVETLRAIREDGALLERHAERWTPDAEGFRVETPDGEVVVDSRDALVERLRRHYET